MDLYYNRIKFRNDSDYTVCTWNEYVPSEDGSAQIMIGAFTSETSSDDACNIFCRGFQKLAWASLNILRNQIGPALVGYPSVKIKSCHLVLSTKGFVSFPAVLPSSR